MPPKAKKPVKTSTTKTTESAPCVPTKKCTARKASSTVELKVTSIKKPIPLKVLSSPDIDADDSVGANGRAKRGSGQVDYHALSGKGKRRRSGAEVAPQRRQSSKKVLMRRLSERPESTSSLPSREKSEAGDPPIVFRSKVTRMPHYLGSSDDEDGGDNGSNDNGGLSEKGESLPEYEGSTATTPYSTEAEVYDEDETEDDSDGAQGVNRKKKSRSDLEPESEEETASVDEDTMEVDEEESKPARRVKKGVQVQKAVDRSRDDAKLLSPPIIESPSTASLPLGRKCAGTATKNPSESSAKKAKKDMKADAGARPGFGQVKPAGKRPKPAPLASSDQDTSDEGVRAHYGGLIDDDDDEEPECNEVHASLKAAKGTGEKSKSMANVGPKVAASVVIREKATVKDVFKLSDLPATLQSLWNVYHATLISYIGSRNDMASPFIINDILVIIKLVFNQVYTGSFAYTKKIGPKEVVYELSHNCIRNWRTKFRVQSTTVVGEFFKSFSGPQAICDYVDGVVPEDDDLDDIPLTFHWRQYNKQGKKGSYEHPSTLKILATHLQATVSANTSWFEGHDRPIQALVMALVVHERGLGLWQTGSWDEEKQKARMSEENWGNAAASYFTAVSTLPKAKWSKIMQGAEVYNYSARARRGLASAARASGSGSSRKGKAREVVELSDDEA
ncbi:hypothetical protein OF83DRAFT_1084962 [Amylostereum chailletii]|nr:hypothetical protein OF83DRAFT_1084962 [Amylostereum chailletii]